jgi:hypothetical protein
MSIFLRKIDSAVAVPVYTISENAIGPHRLRLRKTAFSSRRQCSPTAISSHSI